MVQSSDNESGIHDLGEPGDLGRLFSVPAGKAVPRKKIPPNDLWLFWIQILGLLLLRDIRESVNTQNVELVYKDRTIKMANS